MDNLQSNISGEKVSSSQREERYRKLISVQIETDQGRQFSAIITNLSKHGMGGKTDSLIKERDRITLVKKDFGRVEGEIRWVDGQNFGMLFYEPISIQQFNFFNRNHKGHFVPEIDNGHVWKGFDIHSSTRRPGVTGQFSKKSHNRLPNS